jgi:hypothetical protein
MQRKDQVNGRMVESQKLHIRLQRETGFSAEGLNLLNTQGLVLRVVKRLNKGPFDASNIEREPVTPARLIGVFRHPTHETGAKVAQ